jgi:outer membrane protein OmpA-like peptidoglycan-associated protein
MALPLALIVGVGTTGCATKGFVRTSVGEVNDKVDSLGRSVEETQEATRTNAARIGEVEAATKQAAQSAQQANSAASDAAAAARAADDKAVAMDKANPNNIFIEIEGHTDNVGGKELNERLGLERAEAVKRYLYEQHQVPLHKINVISYGEDKPVAPNRTRADRAKNRRVVVKVLS